MSIQSEKILEDQLLEQLGRQGYDFVDIRNEVGLLANLKSQLEKHNKIEFTELEFRRVLNILSKGSIFDKAKTLREMQYIERENGDSLYFRFLNTEYWCQNEFQVTRQVSMEGKYQNRYDVTILINGLPLCHIELKRKGLELKEAFNQINRYQRHTFGESAGLFQFVQIFVISNGVNTKYYANNRHQSFKQTFYWTDKDNNRLTNILNGFTTSFLERCHLAKMICKYTVHNETHKILMVLRPYQYYAVEALVDRVKTSPKNGYIWHTTGSGKTLTAFKASQIIMKLRDVKKVVFVVDRRDLDYQTTNEFNSFSPGSVDGTEDTKMLVKQLGDNTRLIVTTIQKLNNAISYDRYLPKVEHLKNEKVVFIFDECHRSQFGDTHDRIKNFFAGSQLFGFTGTPIFTENAINTPKGKRITKELFEECLHKYVITDAIRDENVLKFSVEYVGKYTQKEGSASKMDIKVEAIDTEEMVSDATRIEKITDYVIANHGRKTHNKAFTAMFCLSSVKMLTQYYDLFWKKKEEKLHNLRIATVYSFVQNEEDAGATGIIGEELPIAGEPKVLYGLAKDSREKLDEYIEHYNQMFGTNFSTKDSESFYAYYKDISKKVKERKIDLLLVVNMYLTGFDSPTLNTLFVDKNLKYHSLIQAFSRTNRILNEQKSQGNIVVFRNLKENTDEAITLFSNKEAIEEIVLKPIDEYITQFNEGYIKLLSIAPTVKSVDSLPSEKEEVEFVQAFRNLIRVQNVLGSFSDFSWEDLVMPEQLFEDYKSKYLDLHDKVKSNKAKEKVSILDDLDFELELIHRDEINVTYILQLLIKMKRKKGSDVGQEVSNLLNSEVSLRSKKELIEKFIEENLPKIKDADSITSEFESFWENERQSAFENILSEEALSPDKTRKLLEFYLFAEREPVRDEVLSLLEGPQPGILQRKTIGERILKRLKDYVERFLTGMAA